LGILRSIESRLERVVEGSVGRLFRASVAPVELARKLAKELEEGKVVSVTQTYAPNEYTIYLSPRDRTRFADFEASLRNELASYLAEHARRAGYVMPTRPRVRFETESSLHTGIFGISTALVRDDDEAPVEPLHAGESAPLPPSPPPVAPQPETVYQVPAVPVAEPESPPRSPLDPDPAPPLPGGFPAFPVDPDAPGPGDALPGGFPVPPAVPVPLPGAPSFAPLPDAPAVPPGDPDVPPRPPVEPPIVEPPVGTPPAAPAIPAAFELPAEPPLEATMITRAEPHEELVIVHDGRRTPIEASIVQIGRAPSCDIVLDDRNVSRRHAEIRRRGPVVVLIDLDSTNGTIVNGRRVREHPLADGDRITMGNSRLTFERRTT
jgi:FHA domain-containing protein